MDVRSKALQRGAPLELISNGKCHEYGLTSVEERGGQQGSQRELAAKAGLEQAFISRLESGRSEPCLGTIQALADAFDISLSTLFKGL